MNLLVLLGVFFATSALFKGVRSLRKYQRLPPGPGNWLTRLTIPRFNLPEIYQKWTMKYGPVFSLKRAFGEASVIVCDYHAVMEILEKQGASSADRPRSIAAGEMMCGGLVPSQMREGRLHTKVRRGLHAALQPKIAKQYGPIQETNAKQMVLDIIANPSKFLDHILRFAANTSISIAYGHSALKAAPEDTTPSGSSPEKIIAQARVCLARFVRAMQRGTYLVDAVPALAYLPSWMYPPGKQLHVWREELRSLYRGMMQGVVNCQVAKDQTGPGNAEYQVGYEDAASSFSAYCLERQDKWEISDDQLAFMAGSLFGAGTDATSSAIEWLIVAAACNVSAQKKVQAQIDNIVGKDRAPTMDDEHRLSLVVAFYRETYRWRPVSAWGLPHRVTRDINWNGYTIPEGSIVQGNHWLIGRSSGLFDEPEKFNPSRWLVLSPNGQNVSLRDDIKMWAFGFGRRACPGIHVANRSVFLSTAMLLWAFDISEKPGHPIDSMAYQPGANIRPLPFEVQFTPRIPVQDLEKILSRS